MTAAGLLERSRRWPLAAVFLVVLYAALRQRTWSVDGCLHALGADHFMDRHSFPHLLLRPVTFLWVSLWKPFGLVTPAQWYEALQVLFAAFGVAALTILFAIARRRAGEAAAWIALIAVALSRDTVRHITVLDEKPLGMLAFALAVWATDALYRREDTGLRSPPGFDALLPAAGAWALAMFGHLQNALFAIAFLGALAFRPPGPPATGRVATAAKAALIMALVGLALFSVLHAQQGGPAAVPQFLQSLLLERPTPPPPSSPVHYLMGVLQGWTKAFFLVDRLSPRVFLGLAAAGFAVVALAAGAGFARRRDALSGLLAAGCVMLMATMPLANSFPDYGDSYTMVVLGALVLLAAAPRPLALAGLALLVVVNLPAAIAYSRPPVTMARHLEAMAGIQRSQNAPWIILDELSGFPGEQELTPVYYRMRPDLRYERCGLDALPAGSFLVDLPLRIGSGGVADTARVGEVREQIARRGRAVTRALMWEPPRAIRFDFHVYGHYLIVDPAPHAGPQSSASPSGGEQRRLTNAAPDTRGR